MFELPLQIEFTLLHISILSVAGLGLCLYVQYLSCASFLRWLIRVFFHQRTSIYFQGCVFIFPFPCLFIKDLRFLFHGSANIDRFFLRATRVRLTINPLFLLLGHLRINYLYLKSPMLHYFNNQESHTKKHILPEPGRFQIKNIYISRGLIFVEDKTVWPVYHLCVSNIETHKMAVDISAPVNMFFHLKKGQADIAGGQIFIEKSANTGTIHLQDIRWSQIINLKQLPFKSRDISLIAHFRHHHNKKVFIIHGIAGITNKEEGSQNSSLVANPENQVNGFKFSFRTKPEDYRTTLDLGIQKLIEEILASAQPTWLSMGFVWASKGLFKLIKKSDPPTTNIDK